MIARLLEEAGVPPHSLQLEITESRAMPSGHGPLAVLDELRTMGVSVAIDDFGTGYSSLVQLQKLPVDEIKIDRSFVANMAESPSDAAIVQSTIDLARNLGLLVCARGRRERGRPRPARGHGLRAGPGLRPLPPAAGRSLHRGAAGARGSREGRAGAPGRLTVAGER